MEAGIFAHFLKFGNTQTYYVFIPVFWGTGKKLRHDWLNLLTGGALEPYPSDIFIIAEKKFVFAIAEGGMADCPP